MEKQKKMDEVMLDLGYPEHLLGTRYIRQAVATYRPGQSFTRELYPAIARACDTTPSRVERAMRHATATAFRRCDYQTELKYFGNSIDPDRAAPTNQELIARLWKVVNE